MYRFATIACVVACLLGPLTRDCRASPLEDVRNTLTKLNPISGAVSSLISQAEAQGNTVLEKRLEQLNGVLQLAIQQLDGVAKQNISDTDEKTANQIAQLNKYVSDNLLPFDYLVHHNLAEADAFMAQRVDQFYGGFANTICSTPVLKAEPTLRAGDRGITTFKQPGKFTYIYLPGSCLAKYSTAPEAYLTGDNIVPNWSNLWKGVRLEHVSASNSLIQIALPDELLPNSFFASEFGLHLTLKTGSLLGVPISKTQTVPLHICGKIPKLTAHLTVEAVGKRYVRKNVPYPKDAPGIILSNGQVLAHSSTPAGNGNDSKSFPVPTSMEEGWEIDMAPPDYGLIWSINDKRGHFDQKRLDNHALLLSTDGSAGDASLSVALLVKLIQVAPKNPCETPVEWDQAIGYRASSTSDIRDKVTLAIGKECEEARKELAPAVHVRAEVIDATGRSYGSSFLTPNVPAEFKQGSIKITLDNDNHLTTQATPVCDSSELPIS